MATILDNPNFDAESASQTLRSAMKGFGTDEDSIIKVLAEHSNAQRQEILEQYKSMFGRDLISDLKGELGGNLESVIIALMDPFPLFLAKQLHSAIKGAGTDENVLIEIICPRPSHEINCIKDHYQTEFGSSLEDDVMGDTGGDLECLLVSLLQGKREEGWDVDWSRAEADANALIEAGMGQIGTDESVFNSILCTRSVSQLRATFEKYGEISGKGIVETIESELTGHLESGFKAVAKYIIDSNAYFAERLFKSMSGGGTDDEALIRLIITRSEFDLKTVSQAFNLNYGKSLADFISEDCGGDYCNTLLAILGNN